MWADCMGQRVTINQIFADNAKRYLEKYPKTTIHERKVIRAISICRTAEMGVRYYQCDYCKHQELQYNSCRNRHCPQCQNMKKEQWIQDRKSEVLPFTYFHIVFTLPNELNPIVIRNKKTIFKLLFDIAKETLLSVASEEKYFGADIGFFAILHTWGQKLNLHPHLHCVVPGGGYSQSQGKWIQAPNNFLVPIAVLKKRFRSLFLTGLKQLKANEFLILENTKFENSADFQNLIDDLFAKEWVVYLKEAFQNSGTVIEYLARYTHKIAITSHRIISYENDKVRFKYRDYQDGNKSKVAEIDVLKFMRLFLLHVVPKRFVRIRYYGRKREFIPYPP